MTSQKITLLITADYELFLGRNFVGDDEVLFEPTGRLLQLCEKLGVKVTFFADVCSVWAHRKYGLDEYVARFEAQMREALNRGHDVQLHLHPHWLNSTWQGGRWQVATDRMYLAEFGFADDDNSAPAIVSRGVDYLHDLLRPVKSDYRCRAFRAAGLALQPGEKELIGTLLDNGIEIDSSIAKGLKIDLDTVRIDYRRVPDDANWYLSPQSGLDETAPDGLLEIPIATFRCSLPARLGFLYRRTRAVGMRRGAGISRQSRQTRWSNLRTMLSYNLRYLYGSPWFSLSCDTKGHNLAMLIDGFDDYLKRHEDSPEVMAAMINHPKLMFAPQFELLEAFVTAARRHWGEDVRFATMAQVDARPGQ